MCKRKSLLLLAFISAAVLASTDARRQGNVLRGRGDADDEIEIHQIEQKKNDEKVDDNEQDDSIQTSSSRGLFSPTDPAVVHTTDEQNLTSFALSSNPIDISSSEMIGTGGYLGPLMAAAATAVTVLPSGVDINVDALMAAAGPVLTSLQSGVDINVMDLDALMAAAGPVLTTLASGGNINVADLLPILQLLGSLSSPILNTLLPAIDIADTPNIGDVSGTTPDFVYGDFEDYGPPKTFYLAKPESEEPVGENLGGEMFELDFSKSEPTFQKLSDRGFGNPLNKYIWASAINDNGDVCVGTFNVNSNDKNYDSYYASIAQGTPMDPQAPFDGYARLWSGTPITYTEGGEVYCKKGGESNYILTYLLPHDHTGLRNMVYYDGKFYAGSANGPDGPDPGVPYSTSNLYTVDGGPGLFRGGSAIGSWERVHDQGYLNGYDRSIRAMCVSSTTNRLYIGTESVITLTGRRAKILSFDGPSGDKWHVYDKGFFAGAVTQCADIGGGKMLFATSGLANAQMWVIDEANNFDIWEVTGNLVKTFTQNYREKSNGDVPTPTNIIMEFRVFKNMLYTGFLDGNGFQFYRTRHPSEPTMWDWQPVTLDGFADQQISQVGARVSSNVYTWSSAELGGYYFLGTLGSRNPSVVEDGSQESYWSSHDGRGQLWVSADGHLWRCLNADGFGEPWTVGFRTMSADPSRGLLHIGTASDFSHPVRSRAPYV